MIWVLVVVGVLLWFWRMAARWGVRMREARASLEAERRAFLRGERGPRA